MQHAGNPRDVATDSVNVKLFVMTMMVLTAVAETSAPLAKKNEALQKFKVVYTRTWLGEGGDL